MCHPTFGFWGIICPPFVLKIKQIQPNKLPFGNYTITEMDKCTNAQFLRSTCALRLVITDSHVYMMVIVLGIFI